MSLAFFVFPSFLFFSFFLSFFLSLLVVLNQLLHGSATFTNAVGRTFQGPLDPFQLLFDDLFLPISESVPDALVSSLLFSPLSFLRGPQPSFSTQKNDKLGEVVFSKLWSLLGYLCASSQAGQDKSVPSSPEQSPTSHDPEIESSIKKFRDLEGFESVKYLEIAPAGVNSILQQHLSKFIVSVTSESSQPPLFFFFFFSSPELNFVLLLQTPRKKKCE